ncbi:MAG: sigma-70 family RNA polymerase sigma factor [Kiritimatiellae bacterium]|nr:sigma-70 family RNA polymerase sigma factor [Kiritimatiellia bacterium]
MNDGPATKRDASFPRTRWSVILAAGATDSAQARDALDALCAAYWRPLYGFVRLNGYTRHDAEDLTQAFLADFIRRDSVRAADRAKGRFRSYLLGALKHFLGDRRARAGARKRGGGVPHVSWDTAAAEAELAAEPATGEAPDRAFDRQWARALLDRVLGRLDCEYREAGKGPLLEQLRGCLVTGGPAADYAAAAEALGMSHGAVKVAVHRLRKRYRAILREEVALTVDEPADVDSEIAYLFSAMSG